LIHRKAGARGGGVEDEMRGAPTENQGAPNRDKSDGSEGVEQEGPTQQVPLEYAGFDVRHRNW
jgi:hypothetical protein